MEPPGRDRSCVIEAQPVAQDSRYTAATKRATFRLTPIVVFVTSVSYTIPRVTAPPPTYTSFSIGRGSCKCKLIAVDIPTLTS